MGSVAQLPKAQDCAKVVLLTIQRHAQDRAILGYDPDLRFISRTLSEALEDPHRGRLVLLGLAEYLAAATVGVSLNLSSWIPPGL